MDCIVDGKAAAAVVELAPVPTRTATSVAIAWRDVTEEFHQQVVGGGSVPTVAKSGAMLSVGLYLVG